MKVTNKLEIIHLEPFDLIDNEIIYTGEDERCSMACFRVALQTIERVRGVCISYHCETSKEKADLWLSKNIVMKKEAIDVVLGTIHTGGI